MRRRTVWLLASTEITVHDVTFQKAIILTLSEMNRTLPDTTYLGFRFIQLHMC